MGNSDKITLELTRGEAYDVLLSCVSAEINAPDSKKWDALREKISEQLNGKECDSNG